MHQFKATYTLVAEWPGFFMCYCSSTGVEQIPSKKVSSESWTWKRKLSHCSCWDLSITSPLLFATPAPSQPGRSCQGVGGGVTGGKINNADHSNKMTNFFNCCRRFLKMVLMCLTWARSTVPLLVQELICGTCGARLGPLHNITGQQPGTHCLSLMPTSANSAWRTAFLSLDCGCLSLISMLLPDRYVLPLIASHRHPPPNKYRCPCYTPTLSKIPFFLHPYIPWPEITDALSPVWNLTAVIWSLFLVFLCSALAQSVILLLNGPFSWLLFRKCS